MIEITHASDTELCITYSLYICRACNKSMLACYDDLPRGLGNQLKAKGVGQESYAVTGVCLQCYLNGKYPTECVICGKTKNLVAEFRYKCLVFKAYYEDETEPGYVCKQCCDERAKEVLEYLTKVDDWSEIK